MSDEELEKLAERYADEHYGYDEGPHITGTAAMAFEAGYRAAESGPRNDVDYRLLLVKYIKNVSYEEGNDFTSFLPDEHFSAAEIRSIEDAAIVAAGMEW